MTRPSPVFAFAVLAALACLAEAMVRALAARLGGVYLLPSPALAVLAMALLTWPLPASWLLALLLGSEAAHAACAPPGVLEASMLVAATGVGLARGRWLTRSTRDIALAAGLLHLLLHATVIALLLAAGHRIGFATWSAAALLPGALLDAACALCLAQPLQGLWRRLTPTPQRSLAFGRR